MCGRFTLAKSESEVMRILYDDFAVEDEITVSLPRYNIAPRQKVLVLLYNEENIKPHDLTWGFVPIFGRKEQKKLELINVRIESLEDKWFLKEAYKQRRCLIVADGFYEWENTDQGKIPYRIHLKGDELFYFAGLYSKYSLNNHCSATVAIITKKASNMMKVLHHRMPVMFHPNDAKKYLIEGILKEEQMLGDDELRMYPVSRVVNKVSIDSEKCIKKEEPIRLEI